MSIAMFEKQDSRVVHARCLGRSTGAILTFENGELKSAGAAEAPADSRWWMAPPLFDIQVNGFAGIDFQDPALTPEELHQAVAGLEKCGCEKFLLTLVTDRWEQLLAKLERIRSWLAVHPALAKAIAGWHIEGPFLSDQPGFHGAHNPAFMTDPSVERIRQLRHSAGDLPLLLTLAPERNGSIESIQEATRLGIRTSAGHTNASAEQLAAAHQAGLKLFTHLGNAIPRELDRHDNILWRVLDHGGFKISLICDAIHVSPSLFRIIHRSVPQEQLAYTTDAMSAAGSPPGRYKLAGMELEVGTDLVVRQPGKNNFAGSALTPVEGIRRSAAMLDCSWQEVWHRLSTQPARWMGMEQDFWSTGEKTFCLLETGPENQLVGLHLIRKLDPCP